MKLLKWFYYEPKHDNGDFVTELALKRSILASAIGVLLCMTCLFGLTWAWYTGSVITGPNQVSTATYDLDVTVTDGGAVVNVSGDDGSYSLLPNKEYQVTLKRKNDATATKGYCRVYVKGTDGESYKEYYTGAIKGEGVFTFTITGACEIKFIPWWGQCTVTGDKVISNHGSINLPLVSTATPAVNSKAQPETPVAKKPEKTGETNTQPAEEQQPSTDASEQTTENAN